MTMDLADVVVLALLGAASALALSGGTMRSVCGIRCRVGQRMRPSSAVTSSRRKASTRRAKAGKNSGGQAARRASPCSMVCRLAAMKPGEKLCGRATR